MAQVEERFEWGYRDGSNHGKGGVNTQLRHTMIHDTIPIIFVLLINRQYYQVSYSFVCLRCVIDPLVLSLNIFNHPYIPFYF